MTRIKCNASLLVITRTSL